MARMHWFLARVTIRAIRRVLRVVVAKMEKLFVQMVVMVSARLGRVQMVCGVVP